MLEKDKGIAPQSFDAGHLMDSKIVFLEDNGGHQIRGAMTSHTLQGPSQKVLNELLQQSRG